MAQKSLQMKLNDADDDGATTIGIECFGFRFTEALLTKLLYGSVRLSQDFTVPDKTTSGANQTTDFSFGAGRQLLIQQTCAFPIINVSLCGENVNFFFFDGKKRF